MSNSPLVSYTKISPNKTSPRNHKIDTITIHCVVGQLSVESLGAGFTAESRQASSNYGVGTDGRIGMYVEEKDRSWCSSNRANDHRAITIEVASDSKYPYAVNDKAYAGLIDLLVDICQRNGIEKLLWQNDKSLIGQVDKQNMTLHRWFANTECPGEYLYSKHEQIAAEVNARLVNGGTASDTEKAEETDETKNYTKIVGKTVATADQMITRLKSANPDVPQSVIDMIPYYISEGEAEGIRGDIAFAQSCIETGNFAFPNCNVTLDQNNFCGMGVITDDAKGNSFDTPQLGIRAQIQHLKAYASTEDLVNECVDPRFKYVTRASAEYVEWLGIQENPQGKGWASGKNYGTNILRVLNEILSVEVENDANASETTENTKSEASDSTNTPSESSKVPYTVHVGISNLAIWKGPGVSYGKTGSVTKKGIFTIVEEQNDFGKLKSGAGWIPLSLANPKTESDEFKSYLVKVTSAALNVRSGPGMSYGINMCIRDKGIYTIVAESDGWGKLKSGAGWINLNYTTRQ